MAAQSGPSIGAAARSESTTAAKVGRSCGSCAQLRDTRESGQVQCTSANQAQCSAATMSVAWGMRDGPDARQQPGRNIRQFFVVVVLFVFLGGGGCAHHCCIKVAMGCGQSSEIGGRRARCTTPTATSSGPSPSNGTWGPDRQVRAEMAVGQKESMGHAAAVG